MLQMVTRRRVLCCATIITPSRTEIKPPTPPPDAAPGARSCCQQSRHRCPSRSSLASHWTFCGKVATGSRMGDHPTPELPNGWTYSASTGDPLGVGQRFSLYFDRLLVKRRGPSSEDHLQPQVAVWSWVRGTKGRCGAGTTLTDLKLCGRLELIW
jgi:hypothetical protein